MDYKLEVCKAMGGARFLKITGFINFKITGFFTVLLCEFGRECVFVKL